MYCSDDFPCEDVECESVEDFLYYFKVAINMIIWGVLLFISGCLIADAARYYDDKTFHVLFTTYTLCDSLKNSNIDARCGHLVAAAVRY